MRALVPVLVLLLSGCAGTGKYFEDAGPAPAAPPITLESLQHPEIWTGIVFNGDKVGFSRRTLRAAAGAPGRWDIESEAAMRLQFLGVDKRVRLRSLDRVRSDLTLESFEYEHEIDGSRMEISGTAQGAAVQFTVTASGTSERKTLQLETPLYPTSALALLPLRTGIRVGAHHRYTVFHGETRALAEAEQDVLAYETSELFSGPAFKVATRMLGLETTSWIAADGRPLFELGMGGVIISALEDEARARQYLLEASLNKRDSMVDFSLVRSTPIKDPRGATRMEIVFLGFPAAIQVASEGGQSCSRAGERLECRIDRELPFAQGDPKRYLQPTLAAPSVLREISDLARSIAGDAATEDERIARLLAWMDANIAKEAVDGFTAVDVLRERRAECQGHAYLFAAFARALGIPARVVNGLAYSEAHTGFLYHTWNEAWITGRGWQPVDATFGQAHADATHVRLIEGESAADLVPLVALVGRVKVGSVGALRWR
jgi:hypothetical protein